MGKKAKLEVRGETSGGWGRKLAQPRLRGTFQRWETPAVEDRHA